MNIFKKIIVRIESLQTRFYSHLIKNKVKSCGRNFHVFGKVNLVNAENLVLGDDCTLNHDVYLNAFNPITLGNDVTLSAQAMIVSTGIDINKWRNGHKCHIKNKGIHIGNHVWIGAGAKILSGANINAEYVVIAAGAVVTTDITDSYTIWGSLSEK